MLSFWKQSCFPNSIVCILILDISIYPVTVCILYPNFYIDFLSHFSPNFVGLTIFDNLFCGKIFITFWLFYYPVHRVIKASEIRFFGEELYTGYINRRVIYRIYNQESYILDIQTGELYTGYINRRVTYRIYKQESYIPDI